MSFSSFAGRSLSFLGLLFAFELLFGLLTNQSRDEGGVEVSEHEEGDAAKGRTASVQAARRAQLEVVHEHVKRWDAYSTQTASARLNTLPIFTLGVEEQIADLELAIRSLEEPGFATDWDTPGMRMVLAGVPGWEVREEEELRDALILFPHELPRTAMAREAHVQLAASRKELLLMRLEAAYLDARLRKEAQHDP